MKSIKINCVKISAGDTEIHYLHELMKFNICYQLKKEGKHFVTEAIFKNSKRADIIILDDFKIVEILGSETEKQCREKVKDYPEAFEIIMVRARDKFTEKLIY